MSLAFSGLALRLGAAAAIALGVAVVALHPAQRPAALPAASSIVPPPVILLAGAPGSTSTDVVVRSFEAKGATRELGRVTHAESVRRGVPCPAPRASCVLAVVAERASLRGSSYNSALYRIEGGHATRLLGGVVDGSAPMLTAAGDLLLRRGHEGLPSTPAPGAPAPRERQDDLTIEVVDPASGRTRVVWDGTGQTAFLAASVGSHDVAIYHVADDGARLFVLNVATGVTRPLGGLLLPLATDFSYNKVRDELVYSRAVEVGSRDYEVIAVGVRTATERVLFHGASYGLAPRVLSDGSVVIATPDGKGLALLADASSSSPVRLPLFDDPTDVVVGESRDGRWVAVERVGRREALILWERATGRSRSLPLSEFVGFIE